ncbi:MAG: DUF2325 domain-containing protein [Deltaproteobacteria bacterium]|nr:DUF2325 domain-containing protein [Deltaproteobacteria bacterium]
MKNIIPDPKKHADPTVKAKDILATPSCSTAKEGKIPLPDCITLTLLMAMTMNPKDMRKMCMKHYLKSGKHNLHLGYELWGLHHASHDPEKSVAKDLRRYFKRQFSTAPLRVRSMAPEDLAQSIGNRQWPAPILWAASTDSRSEMRKQAQILAHSLIWRLMENCNQLKLGLSVLNHNVIEKKQGLKTTGGHRFHSKVNTPEISVKSIFKRQLQEKDGEILKLKKKLAEYSQELTELRQRPFREATLKRKAKKLAYELEKASKKISEHEKLIESYMQVKDENKSIVQNAGPDKEENIRAGNVFTLLCPEDARGDCGHCTEQKKCTCPLEGMHVAVIGGLDRLEPKYRKTIHDLGADFIFHNGDCSNGRHVLKNVVCKADIILFITSINSHGALKVVKATCKKTGKQFKVVRHPSANSVYKTLSEITG